MSGGGGNLIWWFLLGLTVVALAILFERLLAIRRVQIVPADTASRTDPIKRRRGWRAIPGFAVLMFLVLAAQWQLWARVLSPRKAEPAAPAAAQDHRVHIAVSADGSITAKRDGDPVAFEDLTPQLRQPASDERIELDIDPRARGDAVDPLLVRLRDAGASRCTLLFKAALAAGPPLSMSGNDPGQDILGPT